MFQMRKQEKTTGELSDMEIGSLPEKELGEMCLTQNKSIVL